MSDLERLEQERATSARPLGALALAGAWKEVPEAQMDSLLSDIYAAREQDRGRDVRLDP